MDTKTPSMAAVAKHLKLRPTKEERASGHTTNVGLVEAIVDKGVHTWFDEDGEPHTEDCWAVITVRGGKHYIPKSGLS